MDNLSAGLNVEVLVSRDGYLWPPPASGGPWRFARARPSYWCWIVRTRTWVLHESPSYSSEEEATAAACQFIYAGNLLKF